MYPCELEKVPEFSECSEWVETYDLYKGKSVDDDEPDSHRLSAKFKGNNLRKFTLTNCLYLPDWLLIAVTMLLCAFRLDRKKDPGRFSVTKQHFP